MDRVPVVPEGHSSTEAQFDGKRTLVHADVRPANVAVDGSRETNEASDDHPPHSRITWWAERATPSLRLIERL